MSQLANLSENFNLRCRKLQKGEVFIHFPLLKQLSWGVFYMVWCFFFLGMHMLIL